MWNGSFLISEHLVSKGTKRVIWVRFAVGMLLAAVQYSGDWYHCRVSCGKCARGLAKLTQEPENKTLSNTTRGNTDIWNESKLQLSKDIGHLTHDTSLHCNAVAVWQQSNLRVKLQPLDMRVNFSSGTASINYGHSWVRLRIHASWVWFMDRCTWNCLSRLSLSTWHNVECEGSWDKEDPMLLKWNITTCGHVCW